MRKKFDFARKGYSIVEVVIAMALIVLLSSVGFATCYASLAIQKKSRNYIFMNSASAAFYDSFEYAYEKNGKSAKTDEEKKALLLEFNHNLAFLLNSWEPNVYGFSGKYALGGEPWDIQLVMKTEEKENQQSVSVCGLDYFYEGGAASGGYSFRYRYYNSDIEIRADLTLADRCVLNVNAFRANDEKALFHYSENYLL